MTEQKMSMYFATKSRQKFFLHSHSHKGKTLDVGK